MQEQCDVENEPEEVLDNEQEQMIDAQPDQAQEPQQDQVKVIDMLSNMQGNAQ